MFKVFLIVWGIIGVLLICFEFYAEQEVRRAIGADKEKISNYVAAIIILSGQAIRAICATVAYYRKKLHTDN